MDSRRRRLRPRLRFFVVVCAFFGAAAAADPPTTATLRALLAEVKTASYPELAALPMTTDSLSSSSVFFQSNFDVGEALAGRLALVVDLNEAVLDDPPSDAALRAVLAHELAHSLDYAQRFERDGAAGLVALLPMLVWPPAEEEVERRTDVVAVARGHGVGLIAYRVWLYAHVTDDVVREKRRIYYSPLELDLLTRLFARCPEVVASAVRAPPRDARAIVALGPRCF